MAKLEGFVTVAQADGIPCLVRLGAILTVDAHVGTPGTNAMISLQDGRNLFVQQTVAQVTALITAANAT